MSNKKIREDLKNKKNARVYRSFAIIAGVLVLIVALVVVINKLHAASQKVENYRNVNGFTVGLDTAPVKVEEYSNFNCSHCKIFSQTVEPNFVKKYVDTGKVQFTFHNFPFQKDGTDNAVEAAYCAADQNLFWPMKSTLFNNNGFSGSFAEGNIANYAKNIGLDTTKFGECMQSDKYLPKVEEDRQAAIAKGLDGTPYFFVNGQKFDQSRLIEAVDAQLAQSGK